MKKAIWIALAAFASFAAAEKTEVTTKDLLAKLHDVNQEEISAGRLATERAQSNKVKKYGEHLLKDHEKADEQVLAVAKEEGIKLNKVLPTSASEAGQSLKGDATVAHLKSLSGRQFDSAFVKAMESGHTAAIRMLESSDIKDPKMQRLARVLLPKLKEHKKIAQNLVPVTQKE